MDPSSLIRNAGFSIVEHEDKRGGGMNPVVMLLGIAVMSFSVLAKDDAYANAGQQRNVSPGSN